MKKFVFDIVKRVVAAVAVRALIDYALKKIKQYPR